MELSDDLAAELEAVAAELKMSPRSAAVAILAAHLGVEYMPPLRNGLTRQRDGVYIHVANRHAAICRVAAGTLTYATNWRELERDAMLEVMSQEPSRARELYSCPHELAAAAKFVQS